VVSSLVASGLHFRSDRRTDHSANRIREKSYPGASTATVDFSYDTYPDAGICTGSADPAVGRVTKMTDGTGSTSWCYDSRGREARKHHVISVGGTSFTYDVDKTYDSANRPVQITYPGTDHEILTYTYDDASGGKLATLTGQPAAGGAITTYVSGTQYNHPTGALTELDLGGTLGLKTNYTHDALYRLQSIVSTKGAVTPQNLSYDYWANGNIKNVSDAAAAPVDNLFYNYDELNRLVNVKKDDITTGAVQASYTYGSGADLGKLTVMAEGNTSTTLAYGDADHPHAVTSRSGSPTSQPDGYTYDRDGNIAARTGGEKYTFDAENRLSTVKSYPTQTSYWYDGLGNMNCRWTTTTAGLPSAADVRDRYIDGLYEEHSVFGQSQYNVKNYYAFGRIIAQRKTSSAGSSVTYLLADHLSSTVGTVSDAGVTEHMQYYPFGSVRSGHVSTDRGFTGQRREGGSRLGAYFYNARFYATGLGHFMSADTMSTDGLDRYAYVRFNPLRYSDPSGHGAPGIIPDASGHPCTPDSAGDPHDACNEDRHAPVSDPCNADCWRTIRGLMECAANFYACTHNGAASPAPPAATPASAAAPQPYTDFCPGAESYHPCPPPGCSLDPTEPCPEPGKRSAPLGHVLRKITKILSDPDCLGLVTDVVGAGADIAAMAPIPVVQQVAIGVGGTADAIGIGIDAYQGDRIGLQLSIATLVYGYDPISGPIANGAAISYSYTTCVE
jgi:RHS repeat-associated protein